MRRKRSEFTKKRAVAEVSTFAKRIERWCETSGSGAMRPHDGLDVVIRVGGVPAFGFADNFFEALRVLGGHKLPRRTSDRDEKHG